MNREEAILLLHDMKDTYDEIHENTNGDLGYEQMTALGMAIEALSREQEKYVDGFPSADAVRIETYRELYEKYVELKHASAEAVQGDECDHCVYKWGMKGGDGE